MSIGSDRWVETAGSRTEGPRGWWGRGIRQWNSLPPLGRLGILVALVALVPLVVSSDFWFASASTGCSSRSSRSV